jgi:hypothetical protein
MMRISTLLLVALAGTPAVAIAQALPTFTLTRELLISPEEADLASRGAMAVAPSGEVFVAQGTENLIKVFATSGEARQVGRGGGGPGEFQRLTRIGFVGDSLWALDVGLNRVSIFSSTGEYVRSFPMPGREEREPIPASYYTQAVLPGGDLRVLAALRYTMPLPSWTKGIDSGSTVLVRVSPSGTFRRLLQVIPPSRCRVDYTFSNGNGSVLIPFCPEHVSTHWERSQGVATVITESDMPGRGAYRVTLVDEQGQTRFDRRFPYEPIPVSKGALDSLREREAALPPEFKANRPTLTPGTHYPPIRRAILGRDNSVWLEERTTEGGHVWLILSVTGDPLGRVKLPTNVHLDVAELGRIWGLISDEDDLQGVVRYRLGAAR